MIAKIGSLRLLYNEVNPSENFPKFSNMTTLFQEVKDDLMAVNLLADTNIPPPYMETDSTEQKVKTTYRALLRATRLKNRVLALANAFYLGQVMETETSSPAERTQFRNQMTSYYRQASKRTYYLFETLGVAQIGRTRKITLRTIYNLKSQDFKNLVDEAYDIFAGAANLEEEIDTM